MSEYVPMKGPLPGVQYIPSNGTEGYSFIESWCGSCARDKAAREGAEFDECDDNEVCQILGASFRGEAVEWRDLGEQEVCLAYVQHGQEIPPPRCEHTVDLFEPAGRSEG